MEKFLSDFIFSTLSSELNGLKMTSMSEKVQNIPYSSALTGFYVYFSFRLFSPTLKLEPLS